MAPQRDAGRPVTGPERLGESSDGLTRLAPKAPAIV